MGWFNRPTAVRSTVRTAQLAAALDHVRAGAPRRGQRSAAGLGLHAARMLFSGDVGRLTGDWPTQPMPADWIVYRYQRTFVARSREQAHNNDFMRAYLRLNRQGIVGAAGVLFQSQAVSRDRKADLEGRAAIEAAFADWGRRQHCDVTGKLSWRAMQAACVETAARDGEFFARKIYGKPAGKYGFALQLLDPQRCPVDFDRSDVPGGGFIQHGIEYTDYGKPVAYYFSEQAADSATQTYSYGGKSYRRIPATDILHGFISELPGQKRGLPWLSTGLFRAKQMSATEDAAVVNMRIGAAKMGFIQFKEGANGPEWDDEEGLEIDAEAGAMPILPTGAEFKEFNPQYPNGEFAPFMKFMLRSMAAGGGVAYEDLAQDREGVNFTSIRHGKLDACETFKERQEWLVEELCEGVVDAWLPRALLGGRIVTADGVTLTADQIDRLSPRKWQPRRWEWVDPKSDMAATESAKNNLLASPSQLIRERGKDPDQVWTEIGQDIAAMRERGIPDSLIVQSLGIAPPRDAPGDTPDA